MSFINKIIPGKKILVVDIGTYKVKVALCEYKNNEASVLGYGEKKQEATDIINNEIANIEGVSNTIADAIKKAVGNTNINPKDIIINIPSSNIVSFGKQINYVRTNKNSQIDLNELDNIIGKIEKEALENAKKSIKAKTGYNDVDMKLITSSVTDVKIDNFKVTNPIGFIGENISISILNIFIPASRYHIINTIANYLGKNILSIVPVEFCIPKLFENTSYAYEDILFIDIGNTKTSFIIQKKGIITGFNKIDIGVNDLVKSIKEVKNDTTINILNNINNPLQYCKEKENFLSIWEEGFILSLKEQLNNPIIPHNIFILGGGDYNFIKDFIQKINLNNHNLHSIKSLNFIDYDLENLRLKQEYNIFNKNNLGLASMIVTTKEIVNNKINPIFSILRNFIDKNEF